MKPPASPQLGRTEGFSLIELLVVVALISIVTTVAVQAIVFTRGTALESTMAAQEHTINTSYRAIKATADTLLPTTGEAILALIEADPRIGFPIPRSMEGPDGPCTLVFDPASELFSYVAMPEESSPLASIQ